MEVSMIPTQLVWVFNEPFLIILGHICSFLRHLFDENCCLQPPKVFFVVLFCVLSCLVLVLVLSCTFTCLVLSCTCTSTPICESVHYCPPPYFCVEILYHFCGKVSGNIGAVPIYLDMGLSRFPHSDNVQNKADLYVDDFPYSGNFVLSFVFHDI